MFFKNRSKKSSTQETKPQAVVFVDFDHWHISLMNLFRVEASVKNLLDSIGDEYAIADIFVFGDFAGLDHKISELATITGNLFDVQGDKKSDKDAIILDKLYRCGVRHKGTDTTVIIVSGNGRLLLASRFLKEEWNMLPIFHQTCRLLLKLARPPWRFQQHTPSPNG